MSETETIPEPDWLAAEPTAQRKLTAIMAAVRRCYAECWPPLRQRTVEPTGPHLSTTMAEVFLGQLLMQAAADEREACAELATERGARYGSVGGSSIDSLPFADLLRAEQ
jgi:hypothetical protein